MVSEESTGLSTEEIEAQILEFMTRELLSPGVTIRRDDELLTDEIVDSVGVVRLAAFVEEEFRLDMQPGDFVIENFRSIAVLAEYVGRAARR